MTEQEAREIYRQGEEAVVVKFMEFDARLKKIEDMLGMNSSKFIYKRNKIMKKDAILSKDRKYRYVLSRIWDESKPMVMIIGLNPSTADETEDDPTIVRCVNFAKSWGYGGVYMLNLFAFRATKPEDMFNTELPIGNDNDKYIEKYSKICDKIVCAWGNDGNYKNRSKEILSKIKNLYYLKLNKTGEPAHPLYLKSDLVPIKFEIL